MSGGKEFPRDPVCGRRMNRNKAYAVVRYNKVDYLLCCPKCQSDFEADPERYEAESRLRNGR
ncbi:MAG: TRASH domain-containing protein [Spirochaetia bacterium]|jgi:YHS domain-containing protein